MNIALWILQVLLALHTAMGGVWKFSTSSESMPSLSAIPNALWMTMGGLELVVAVALVVPWARFGIKSMWPFAAGFVIVEMLLFTVLHLMSGDENHGQIIYWLVVAALCSLIVYGRTRAR